MVERYCNNNYKNSYRSIVENRTNRIFSCLLNFNVTAKSPFCFVSTGLYLVFVKMISS